MVEYNGKPESSVPLMGQKQKRRPMTEVVYEDEDHTEKKHKQPNSGGHMKEEKKPDALKHPGKNVFKPAEKPKCPGQMYVTKPNKEHNESDFAGEHKQKQMY